MTASKVPSCGERADVQLVDQGRGERPGLELVVGPAERGVVDDPRRAVDAVRLPAGSGVGQVLGVVDVEGIFLAGPGAVDRSPATSPRPGGSRSIGMVSPATFTETLSASGAQTR